MEEKPEKKRSWIEEKIAALDAVYRKFGREGLKDASLADVNLLLTSKELTYRDAPKSRDITEDQKSANRMLEIEIRDLGGYVNSQLAAANVQGNRLYRHFGITKEQAEQYRQKERQKEPERER